MSQTTHNLLMIRPKNFGFNQETAANNSFQTNDQSLDEKTISTLAVKEFDDFVAKLRYKGINIEVFEDTDNPKKTDAVFPNNWISMHDNGMIMTYPMYSPNRRKERRRDIIEALTEKYKVSKDYTFEHYEEEGFYLEGTGSLILDRENKIAYANLSQRTDLQLFEKWSVLIGYRKIHFLAKDRNQQDIYHTNVMMALGSDICIICLECIPESKEKEELLQSLTMTNKIIIDISLNQVEKFAGNMLEVNNKNGKKIMVMSSTAFNALTAEQVSTIEQYVEIIVGDIPTIEKYGGGSVRCMLGEIFLEEK